MRESTPGTYEALPALYRSILSLVGELERCDGRREAGRIRTQALAVYEAAWDERHHRRLAQLEDRLRRAIAAQHEAPRTRLRLP